MVRNEVTSVDGLYTTRTAYVDGIKNGESVTYVTKGGLCRRAYYKNGKLNGTLVYYIDNIARYRFVYENGMIIRETVHWNDDDITKGKLSEAIKYYPTDGDKKLMEQDDSYDLPTIPEFIAHDVECYDIHDHLESFTYNNRFKKNGYKNKYDCNGCVIERYRYGCVKGIMEETYEYYRNNVLVSRIMFKDLKIHGSCEEWYESRKFKRESIFANGVLSCICLEYHPNGVISSHIEYLSGEPVMIGRWDSNGIPM